jgi:hypothetical protein
MMLPMAGQVIGWLLCIPLGLGARSFAREYRAEGRNRPRWIVGILAWMILSIGAIFGIVLCWQNSLAQGQSALDYLGVFLMSCCIHVPISFGPAIVLAVLALRTIGRPPESCTQTHCDNCKNDLTGNVSGICPECGTPIPNRARERIVASQTTNKGDKRLSRVDQHGGRTWSRLKGHGRSTAAERRQNLAHGSSQWHLHKSRSASLTAVFFARRAHDGCQGRIAQRSRPWPGALPWVPPRPEGGRELRPPSGRRRVNGW